MPSVQQQPTYDIAIVGGGIAGLCLAIGLLKQNVKVTIYEGAHSFGEIGAGVAFGPNGINAMKLLDPEVEKAFDEVATYNLWESKRQQWFEYHVGQEPDPTKETGDLRFLYAHPCPMGQATCSRAHLLDELIKLVPEGVAHFAKRLTSMEDLGGEEGIRLTFKDGTQATHQAVVGCDGIKSVVRLHVLGEDDPASHAVFSGSYCHRALLPMEKAVEILGDEKAMNNMVYPGKHGHMTTFPIDKGRFFNIVAFHSKDTWDHKDWVIPSTTPELLADYEGWSPTLRKLLGEVKERNLDIWALFDYPSAHTYYKGNVCLSGDAAHASTPHQGSGAAMAIEDGYILSSLIREALRDGNVEIGSVFKAFDAVRRVRTQKLATTSREAGLLWGMELKGVGEDVNKIVDIARNRMEWIWSEDLPAEVQAGKQHMGL